MGVPTYDRFFRQSPPLLTANGAHEAAADALNTLEAKPHELADSHQLTYKNCVDWTDDRRKSTSIFDSENMDSLITYYTFGADKASNPMHRIKAI